MAQLAEISDWIVVALHKERESLDLPDASALLQHYGMPSRMVDVTGRLDFAFAFAANGECSTGRLAVVPYTSCQRMLQVLDLFTHPWAERARRQAAYAIVMTLELADLKSDTAWTRLNIKWYQFKILPSERGYYEEKQIYRGLLRESDDRSAGFVRYYITRYVEACGKLSPALTEWLLKSVPIAPYCYFVNAVEKDKAVVFFSYSDALPAFNVDIETERSRRYWSLAHDDHSEERIRDWVMPAPGSIVADPRTYHPEAYA